MSKDAIIKRMHDERCALEDKYNHLASCFRNALLINWQHSRRLRQQPCDMSRYALRHDQAIPQAASQRTPFRRRQLAAIRLAHSANKLYDVVSLVW